MVACLVRGANVGTICDHLDRMQTPVHLTLNDLEPIETGDDARMNDAFRTLSGRLLTTVCISALPALAACGSTSGENCTLADYSSGVEVVFEDSSWSLRDYCIDNNCADPQGQVGDDPALYSYRLHLVSPKGLEMERTGVVSTSHFRVNGRKCPPQTANAVLYVSASGDVIAKPIVDPGVATGT